MYNLKLGHLLLAIFILSLHVVDSLSTTASRQINFLALAINVPLTIAWRRRRRYVPPACGAGQYYAPACTSCSNMKYGTSNVAHYNNYCNACAAGKFSGAGAASCTNCPQGTYRSASQTYCYDCGTGTYATAGKTKCTDCPTGKYQNQILRWSCKGCGTGQYQDANKQTGCKGCPTGWYQDQNVKTDCKGCPTGKYQDYNRRTGCKDCPTGQYQETNRQPSCKGCPTGQYQDQSGQAGCKGCPTGKYQDQNVRATCKDCPTGKYQNQNEQIGCKGCPTGQYQDQNVKAICKGCPTGKYQDLNVQAGCKYCPTGQYQNQNVKTDCKGCTPGQYQNQNAKASCKGCPTGQYQDQNVQAGCKECGTGQYQDQNRKIGCKGCPTGQYQNQNVKAGCKGCGTGQYQDTNKQIGCKSCPTGQYQDQNAKAGCKSCPIGQYQNQNALPSCKLCPTGKYQDQNEQSGCKSCPGGQYQGTTGESACGKCTAGKFSVATAFSCTKCRAGKHQPQDYETTCLNCGVGQMSSEGADSCTDCNPGTYVSGAGTATCSVCPSGQHSKRKASACIDCILGKYSIRKSSGCTICPKGYRAGNKAPSCTICGSGTVSSAGASTCQDCAAGQYQPNSGSASCILCEVGKWQEVVATITCKNCPNGKWQEATGTGTIGCKLCDAGTTTTGSTKPYTSCTSCARGSYAASAGESICVNCPIGWIAKDKKSTNCVACNAGQVQPDEGGGVCIACKKGKFQGSSGKGTCPDCVIGAITSGPGRVVCEDCIVGMFAPTAGLDTCTACAKGMHAENVKMGLCEDCDAGKFTNSKQQKDCGECLEGQHASGQAKHTSCTQCPLGFAAANKGSPECDICSVGMVAKSVKSLTCLDCALGKKQSITGQAVCDQCPEGYHADQEGESECSSCEIGTFTDVPGMINCDNCLAGQYAGSRAWAKACDNCPKGWAAVEKSPACTICPGSPKNQWQDKPMQGKCMDCGSATLPGATECEDGKCATGLWSKRTDCPHPNEGVNKCTDDEKLCRACDEGKYQNERSMSGCKKCTFAHYQSEKGQTRCSQCKKGKYGTLEEQISVTAACLDCTEGRWSDQKGLSHPSSVSGTACKPCPKGGYGTEKGSRTSSQCELCSRGTYSASTAATNSNTCIACENGKWSKEQGAISDSICQDCEAGYFNNEEAAMSCVGCIAGKIQPDSGESQCELCSRGKFQASAGSTECTTAPTGKYVKGCLGAFLVVANGGRRRLNTKWEGGTSTEAVVMGDASSVCTTNPGTETAEGCNAAEICPAGYMGDSPPTGDCKMCDSGKFSPKGAVECGPCGKGAYGSTRSLLDGTSAPGECVDCPKGWFNDNTQATECKKCGPGEYTASIRENECSECRAGKFSRDSARETICEDCAEGSIQPLPAKTLCTVCAAGQKEMNQLICTDCEKQEYSASVGSSICDSCESGYVNNEKGQTSCTMCTTGTYSGTIEDPVLVDSDGVSIIHYKCLDCQSGQYQNQNAQVEMSSNIKCKQCSIGQAQPDEKQSSCIECDPGTYQWEPQKETCSDCLLARFSATKAASKCDECPTGWIQPDTKQSSCTVCSFGTHQKQTCDKGESEDCEMEMCEECKVGKFGDAEGLTRCKDCAPGQSQPEKKSNRCTECSVGQYASDKASKDCSDCDKGNFAAETGSISCLDCPAGWIQPQEGVEKCDICAAGRHEGASGEHVCNDCSKGLYAATSGLMECQNCPVGYIQPETKQDLCTACAAGREANLDTKATECFDCPKGYFASVEAYFIGDPPRTIANGSKTSDDRRSECSMCPGGWYQPLASSDLCLECSIGKRSTSMSDSGDLGTGCVLCEIGKFAAAKASTTCTDCPNGYVDLESQEDQSGCILCKKGTRINGNLKDIPSTKCEDCKQGTYAAGDASNRTTIAFWEWDDWVKTLTCRSCPKGWFQKKTGQDFCTQVQSGSMTVLENSMVSKEGATGSTPCTPGRFSNKAGQTRCEECPKGHYQPSKGASYCEMCKAGMSQPEKEKEECKRCNTGRYSEENGKSNCEKCEIGDYQDARGQVDCKECIPGQTTFAKGLSICSLQQINNNFEPPFIKSLRPLDRNKNTLIVELELNVQHFYYSDNREDNLIPYPGKKFNFIQVPDRQLIIIQWSDVYTPESLPEMNERSVWPSLECGKSTHTVDDNEQYLGSMHIFCMNVSALPSYGVSSDDQKTVKIHVEIETKHKGPVWERPIYIEAAYILVTGTTGKWTPTYESAAVATECSNTESKQQYLRTHPSDNTCKPPLGLLQLRTDCRCNSDTSDFCTNGTQCKDRSMIKDEDMIKCVSCPDGGNCMTDTKNLEDGRIVPRPGMFLWNIGQLKNYWRIPWSPMHGDMLDNDGDFQIAPQFFHPCPRRGACYGINGPPKLPDDPLADKYWGQVSGFLGGWKNSSELNNVTAWTCPLPHPLTQCKEGTEGPLCALCANMWVRIGGQCQKCYPVEARVVSVIIAILVIGLFLALLQSMLRKLAYKYRAAFRDVSRQFVCLLNLGQILVTVTVMLDVPWPDNLIAFFDLFDFVNLDLTALTGATCDKSVNFHVTFTAMSLCPVVVVVFLIWQYCKGKIVTTRTVRRILQDETRKEQALVRCYKDLFAVVDADKSGHLDAVELIDLLKLIGYSDTKEHVLDVPKAHRLIRLAADSRYTTEITEELFLSEIKSGKLIKHLDMIFDNDTNKKNKKNKKGTKRKSLLHDNIKILAWNEKRKLITTLLNIGMPLLVLFHTPVSKKVFQFFDCDRIGSGDWSKSFLRVDYSIPCSEGEHWLPSYYYFLPYVCVVLVFFTTLLPLSIAIYLRYHRNNLYTPSVLLNLGWLYDRMRRGSEHWELYEMVRKMILTGLIVFFPRNPIIRACLCVLVCVVATAGLNYYRPHKNYLVFWIDQICHAVALLVYVVAMVFASGIDEKSKDQIGDVFIAIFVVLFLIFLAAVIRTIVLVRKDEFQEEFQNHTNVEKLASLTSVNSRRLVNSMAGHVNRKMLHEKNASIELEDMQEGLEEFDLEKMRNLRSKGWKGLISVNSKHFHSKKSSARRIDSILNATELSKIFKLDKQMASNNQQNGGSLSNDDEDELHQRIGIKRRQSMKDRRKARSDKRKARQEELFKQGTLLDKEAVNQQDHPDYLTIKHLMQRLNHQGKLERVIKTISSEDGIIILNRLKTLLKQLKCSDINGLIAFMLTKLSNDDGKTISKNKFKAYCGMLATTKSKIELENEKFQHPEYKAMRILFERLHRQGKLDRIVDKISTEDGKDIKLKSFRKLLKQLKCIDINGFSTFLLKELSGEKENMYSVEKFKEWVDN